MSPFLFYENPVVVPPGKEFATAHVGVIDGGRRHTKPAGEHLVGVAAELNDVDRDVFAEQHIAVILLNKAGDATLKRGYGCAQTGLGTALVRVRPQGSGQSGAILAAAEGEQSDQTLAA